MSIESAKAFYSRIIADEAFRTQLQSTASEERTAFIQAAGYDFTPEEWEAATEEALTEASSGRELEEAELESVAGGAVTIYGTPLPPDLRWPFDKYK